MLSGTLSTSCMTTPHSSRRFCSLFSFFANTAPATSVRHVAATKYFFITDLHGPNHCVRFPSEQIFHRRAFQNSYITRGLCVTRLSGGTLLLRTKKVSWLQRRARRFLPPTQVHRVLGEWKFGHVFLPWRGSAQHPEPFPGAY